jgi:hypothetical protein
MATAVLTFLYQLEEDLDKDAVLGCLQRVIVPISRQPAVSNTAKRKLKCKLTITTIMLIHSLHSL